MEDRDRKPVPTPVTAGVMQNAFRLTSVLRALLPQYRALRRFTPGISDTEAPARFAASLVALGPIFVKLGQMLSTRPDVMYPRRAPGPVAPATPTELTGVA